jgi:5-methylcytosine-specific restriction enzyme A
MPTYLLTWNPQSWPWDDLADEARRLRRGKGLEGRWGCGNSRSIKPGDRFFFLRQGRPPRGIIASGRITSAPRTGKHWNLERRKKGVLARYVDLGFEVLLDPEREAPLGVAELTRGPLAKVHWRTQISGIRIADDAAALLETLWAAHVAGERASAKHEVGGPSQG